MLLKCENLNPGGSFIDRIWLESMKNDGKNEN